MQETDGTAAERAPTRKAGRHLRVPVLPDEETASKPNADNAGLAVAAYLRNLGLGFEPRSVIDHRQVAVLAKISADQARLGNLLKMWLADDERLRQYEPAQMRATIEHAMQRIQEFQAQLLQTVKKLES